MVKNQSKESVEKVRSPKRDTLSAGAYNRQHFRKKLQKVDHDAVQEFMNKSSINFYKPRPSNQSEGPTSDSHPYQQL